ERTADHRFTADFPCCNGRRQIARAPLPQRCSLGLVHACADLLDQWDIGPSIRATPENHIEAMPTVHSLVHGGGRLLAPLGSAGTSPNTVQVRCPQNSSELFTP
ncbi:MAG: hypothetical protein ACI8W7_004688, partial [Gammaproteobacteria bacterium]